MKKIMSASLIPENSYDIESGLPLEWKMAEVHEEEYGESWDGDVRGYVENLDLPDDMEISDNAFAIWNYPENAVIITLCGTPHSIFFAE